MTAWRTLDGRPTRIIAHRGASGLFPEHSRPAYERAVADGADVLEPDLVPSGDGVLFTRHDAWLSRSTDVDAHAEYAERRAAGIDGREDWWSDQFSADELRGLHAVQPFAQRDPSHNGRHPILDFEDVLDLAAAAGRPVYPELKHPSWFAERGIDVVELLVSVLDRRGIRGLDAPAWVQCFEFEALRRVSRALGLRVFPLARFDLAAPRAALDLVVEATAEFAAGIAVDKRLLLLPDAAAWVDRQHDAGREVHAWTFRDDVLAAQFAHPEEELVLAFALGVDAVFCDFPATGVRARKAFDHRLSERR